MTRFLALILAALGTVHAATLAPVQLLNPAGSTAGQAIVSSGPNYAPAWATVTAGSLSPIGANTVYGNFTGSSASPIANAVPGCSTANSALKYTTSTGLSCGTAFALTSGNLSQFASTTSAQLLGLLSDETGTGSAVFNASPSFTGTVGVAAISASGAITPSTTAGIVGTTIGDNANAGSVGELQTASSTLTPAANGVPVNATSISLPPGDWDVTGVVQTNPSATTTQSSFSVGISQGSGTFSTFSAGFFNAQILIGLSIPVNNQLNLIAPVTRINIASNTTVYLISQSGFAGGALTVNGFIRARRVR